MSIDRITYRVAQPDDQAFLDDMNVTASFWSNPESELLDADIVFTDYPNIAEYSEGFGRNGDMGLIAMNEWGHSVGAIWAREYDRTPEDGPLQDYPYEVTMAVRESARDAGIGRQLLDSFATMAWLHGHNELVLGVDVKNYARGLYESVGFQAFHEADGTESIVGGRYVPMIRPLGFLKVETLGYDSELSIANISLRGLNRKKLNRVSATTYHVTGGEGVMNIDGTAHVLTKGLTIEVPPNTPYFDEGNVDMRAVSTPPFDRADVVELPF